LNRYPRGRDQPPTGEKQGVVVSKLMIAIAAAAFIAAAITVLSAPVARVDASPRPVAEAAQMRSCAQRPWPYLRCVGTPFGNPRVRLVSTDRISN
jgi:hypothetical protein